MGVSVGREVLDSSIRVANDVASGDSFKQSLNRNASNSYNSLVNRAIGKLGQTGGRRPKRRTTRRVKKKKTVRKSAGRKKAAPRKKVTRVTPNICLFDTPPSQVAFSKGKWMTFSPSNPIEPKGPYTFNVFDSAHFFQLNKTYLTFKAHLSSVKKKDEGGTKTAVPISHTNFIGATFFNQVKLSYNNVLVYDSSHYAYKAYIQTLLGESDEMKEGFLSAARWSNDEDSLGAVLVDKRRLQEDGTNGLDICTPLFLEPFQTDKLLIPHINIQLTLYRNNDAFCLESTEADAPAKIFISDLKLHMRAIDVVPSATIALENRLRTTPAQYPFKNLKMKVITIPPGRTELPFNVLYQDILPRRVIVGLIDPEAMEGSFTKNALNFAHHDVSEIQLDAGGTVYPPQPIQCDFVNKNYAQAFARLYEELGALSEKSCPRITYKMFRNGYAFYVFNLTAMDNPNSWELIQSGTTQLYIRFNKKTPDGGLNACVLSEYDGMITIDAFRNTTYVDVNLASYMLMMGRLENLSPARIQDLNQSLKSLNIVQSWNACNGCPIGLGAELSLDATPRSHHFINNVIPKPPARRRSVSTKRYFEEKYQVRLNYPNSPLLRDTTGSMYPLEIVWLRIRIY
ncbi:hypothetical protein B9Z55_011053 [Caenorhabditis nigoni]|nr:hypothetical protein B9Z55_011053 [Caenorhabditis nigoni]